MAITRIGNPALADIREPNFRNIIINGNMAVSQRGTSFDIGVVPLIQVI